MIEPCKFRLPTATAEQALELIRSVIEKAWHTLSAQSNNTYIRYYGGRHWGGVHEMQGCEFDGVDLPEITWQDFLAKYEQKPEPTKPFKCDLSAREDRDEIAARTAEYLEIKNDWISDVDLTLVYDGDHLMGIKYTSFDRVRPNNIFTADQLLEMIGYKAGAEEIKPFPIPIAVSNNAMLGRDLILEPPKPRPKKAENPAPLGYVEAPYDLYPGGKR